MALLLSARATARSRAISTSSGWQLLNWNGDSAWADYNGRQLRINVQQPELRHGTCRATVNVAQAGRYQLSFRAKADGVRSSS